MKPTAMCPPPIVVLTVSLLPTWVGTLALAGAYEARSSARAPTSSAMPTRHTTSPGGNHEPTGYFIDNLKAELPHLR
jgi:hypothetical protein